MHKLIEPGKISDDQTASGMISEAFRSVCSQPGISGLIGYIRAGTTYGQGT